MKIEPVSHKYGISAQIDASDLPVVAQAGYKAIVCIRPDGEETGQPRFEEIARVANSLGVKAVHIPVSGTATAAQLRQFREVCAHLPKPVLGYCRSGSRAANIYARTRH